jgi:tetratricopeptide (TPR) repeat protein
MLETKGRKIREERLGKNNINTAWPYYNIGNSYSSLGDHSKSLDYHMEALAILEKVHGKEHADTGRSYHYIGIRYASLGDNNKAIKK